MFTTYENLRQQVFLLKVVGKSVSFKGRRHGWSMVSSNICNLRSTVTSKATKNKCIAHGSFLVGVAISCKPIAFVCFLLYLERHYRAVKNV